MKIYVTRHGETDYNTKNLISGISEATLTDKGRLQAREVSTKLLNKRVDIIFSSPLQRAIETASIINETIQKEMIIDERLHEIDFGDFEGVPNNPDFQEVKKNHATHYPGGESLFQVVARVYQFLDELKTKDYDAILIVCHGGIVRVIHSYFNDMTNHELFTWLPENCCLNEYEL